MSEAIWITAIDLTNLEDTHPETEPCEVRRREANARPSNLRVSAARRASALSPAARPTSQSGSKVSVPSMSTNRIFSAQPGAGLPQDFSRLIRVDVPTSCRLAVPSLETALRHRSAIGMCRKMLRGRDRAKPRGGCRRELNFPRIHAKSSRPGAEPPREVRSIRILLLGQRSVHRKDFVVHQGSISRQDAGILAISLGQTAYDEVYRLVKRSEPPHRAGTVSISRLRWTDPVDSCLKLQL